MFQRGYDDAKAYAIQNGTIPIKLSWHQGIASDIKDYMKGWNEFVSYHTSTDVIVAAINNGKMVSFEI